jgi:hypothetical protein
MAKITCGGKKRKYPLAIMDQILRDVDPEREVRVLYDIGCTLKKNCHWYASSFLLSLMLFHRK